MIRLFQDNKFYNCIQILTSFHSFMVILKQYAQASTETFYFNRQTKMAFKTVAITLVPTQQNLSTQLNPMCGVGFHRLIKWVKKNIFSICLESAYFIEIKKILLKVL